MLLILARSCSVFNVNNHKGLVIGTLQWRLIQGAFRRLCLNIKWFWNTWGIDSGKEGTCRAPTGHTGVLQPQRCRSPPHTFQSMSLAAMCDVWRDPKAGILEPGWGSGLCSMSVTEESSLWENHCAWVTSGQMMEGKIILLHRTGTQWKECTDRAFWQVKTSRHMPTVRTTVPFKHLSWSLCLVSSQRQPNYGRCGNLRASHIKH